MLYVNTACEQDKQAVYKPVWHIPLMCVQWKTADIGQRNCPKHIEFYSKNIFQKSVYLVGFIEIYSSFVLIYSFYCNTFQFYCNTFQVYCNIFQFYCNIFEYQMPQKFLRLSSNFYLRINNQTGKKSKNQFILRISKLFCKTATAITATAITATHLTVGSHYSHYCYSH